MSSQLWSTEKLMKALRNELESLYKLLALLSFLISHFKKEHESGLSKIKLVKYLFNKRQK